MTLASDTTLGDLVAAHPAAAPVLDRLGLDYCCHGDRSLAAACSDAGVDPEVVEAALANATAVPSDSCGSYRSQYERLEALELDTHVHIHKENHTLFPAVVALFNG